MRQSLRSVGRALAVGLVMLAVIAATVGVAVIVVGFRHRDAASLKED